MSYKLLMAVFNSPVGLQTSLIVESLATPQFFLLLWIWYQLGYICPNTPAPAGVFWCVSDTVYNSNLRVLQRETLKNRYFFILFCTFNPTWRNARESVTLCHMPLESSKSFFEPELYSFWYSF